MRMGYGMNIFDYIEDGEVQGEQARWSARSPFRPHQEFDLMLVPRGPEWRQDEGAAEAVERDEAEPWVEGIAEQGDEVLVRLGRDWIEQTGARLEAGEGVEGAHA